MQYKYWQRSNTKIFCTQSGMEVFCKNILNVMKYIAHTLENEEGVVESTAPQFIISHKITKIIPT